MGNVRKNCTKNNAPQNLPSRAVPSRLQRGAYIPYRANISLTVKRSLCIART